MQCIAFIEDIPYALIQLQKKSGDFGLEDEKNVPGSRKNLKMQNWRPYLKKIYAKRKKNLQTHWELTIQQFPNV